jgi:asparagine synthase (glutamine-hydrolysing)
MCGIVGISAKYPIENPNLLLKMREAMMHRGPDSAGIWWSLDRRLGLAHRRLAVLELSERGHQPMKDKAGQNVIIFNGEIYNHRQLREELEKAGHIFISHSDTEVLLECYKKWGRDCLEHLDGAFAFALFDGENRELFLARDRAGEKPLYYHFSDNGFVFSSELKALMADPAFPRKLDLESLDYYLAYGYVAGPRTILKNTNKLLPGHAMVYRLDKTELSIWRYWSLPQYNPQPDYSIEDYRDELEVLLCSSVSKQLEADVPVGVLLSGGLDSSLITALAARASTQPVKTFTVSFPGHKSFDEGPYARLVADYFGTEHSELIAEPGDVIALFPKLAWQYDEPIGDHSVLPSSMLAELVGQSVTVALGGDGGDELFGGYPHYNFVQKIMRYKRYIPELLRDACALMALYSLPVGAKGRNHLIGFQGGARNSLSAINVCFDPVFRRRLLSPLYRSGYAPLIFPEDIKLSYFDDTLTVFQNAARLDFYTTMVDDYLVKTDRASMRSSLELRAPFLDHHLIEFAFGKLPDSLRATENEKKILLRRLAQKILPQGLDINRKAGFTLPLAEWFKGKWGNYTTEVLMEADPRLFNKNIIVKLITLQRKGFFNTNRLFALVMFELWRREYAVDVL